VNTSLFISKAEDNIKKENDFIIVCAGNINDNKNQLILLRALKELKEQVRLVLFGNEDAEYRRKMDAFIATHNLETRVTFKGYLDNRKLPEALHASDLFVLPSFNEGFPVSLLEAMACGIPVLCSDSGGGSRYILEDRYIFQPDNVAELVEKINMIINLSSIEKEKLCEAHQKLVQKRFTEESEVNAYEKLFLNFE